MNRKTILIVAVVAYIAYVYLKPGQHTAQATVMSVLDGFGISGGGMSTKVAVAVMFLLFVFRDSEHMPDIIKSYQKQCTPNLCPYANFPETVNATSIKSDVTTITIVNAVANATTSTPGSTTGSSATTATFITHPTSRC
jgi:hypothetical protein